MTKDKEQSEREFTPNSCLTKEAVKDLGLDQLFKLYRKITFAIADNDGRLTSNSSQSLDLFHDNLEVIEESLKQQLADKDKELRKFEGLWLDELNDKQDLLERENQKLKAKCDDYEEFLKDIVRNSRCVITKKITSNFLNKHQEQEKK